MVRPPLSCGEDYRKEEGTMKKGAWTAEEDEKLVAFIEKNRGHGSWRTLPKLAGLERCGKSCRLRWSNYLRPNIKRGNFSADEESIIVQLHALLGNKWSTIASHLPGRTDNEVKNHWNTHLRKKLTKMGIDPATHLPFNLFPAQRYLHSSPSTCAGSSDWQKALLQHSLQVNSTIACHLVQWELARLEAEARQQLTSSQATYIRKSCTPWLQNLHQNQVTGYGLNASLAAANVQTQPEDGQSLSNVFSATQIHSLTNHLGCTSPLPCQGSNGRNINSDTLQKCSPLIKEELEHYQEDCVLTCASGGSVGTLGTPTSSDSLSSHLLPIELEVSDDLRSLARSADEISIANKNIDPHDSSPVSLDQPAGPQDSYWNRILNFLDQVDLENL